MVVCRKRKKRIATPVLLHERAGWRCRTAFKPELTATCSKKKKNSDDPRTVGDWEKEREWKRKEEELLFLTVCKLLQHCCRTRWAYRRRPTPSGRRHCTTHTRPVHLEQGRCTLLRQNVCSSGRHSQAKEEGTGKDKLKEKYATFCGRERMVP